jgi:hypothetical protein
MLKYPISQPIPAPRKSGSGGVAKAFSSEVDTGSREEKASK